METDDLSKQYYKIKDVAEMLDVSQATLRYWEQEFPECRPERSPKNQRYYRPSDIKILRIIHYLLKVKGLKIEAAKEQLRLNPENISKRVDIIRRLTEVRDELKLIQKALEIRK